MKKILIFGILILLSVGAMAQTRARTGLTVGDHRVSGTNIVVVDTITTDANGKLTFFIGGSTDTASLHVNQSDLTAYTDVLARLTDTIPMINATIGQGNAGDTTLFSYGDVPWGIKWDGSFNLVITKVNAVVHGTTPDIDIQLYHDVNFRDATPTTVLSSNLTVTNTTTGADATSFSSATIAPGQWLYVQIKQCTAQPTQAILNIYGYLTR